MQHLAAYRDVYDYPNSRRVYSKTKQACSRAELLKARREAANYASLFIIYSYFALVR